MHAHGRFWLLKKNAQRVHFHRPLREKSLNRCALHKCSGRANPKEDFALGRWKHGKKREAEAKNDKELKGEIKSRRSMSTNLEASHPVPMCEKSMRSYGQGRRASFGGNVEQAISPDQITIKHV